MRRIILFNGVSAIRATGQTAFKAAIAYLATGLLWNTSYQVRVAGRNADHQGPWSTIKSVSTAPFDLNVQLSNINYSFNRATVTFNDSAPGANSYRASLVFSQGNSNRRDIIVETSPAARRFKFPIQTIVQRMQLFICTRSLRRPRSDCCQRTRCMKTNTTTIDIEVLSCFLRVCFGCCIVVIVRRGCLADGRTARTGSGLAMPFRVYVTESSGDLTRVSVDGPTAVVCSGDGHPDLRRSCEMPVGILWRCIPRRRRQRSSATRVL